MNISNWMIAAGAAVLLGACGDGRDTQPDAVETAPDGVESLVADWVADTGFSGVVLVARADQTLFEAHYGDADREAGVAVDADTAFGIASLTKTFTTVLVLQQIEAGRLTLDDTLADLLPGFSAPYADQVTVRQLLQNRSGIPHYTSLPDWFTAEGKRALTPDVLMLEIAALPLSFEPGADYLYSNVNFYLLGRILDEVAEAPYEQLLDEHLLTPLGLGGIGQIYDVADTTTLAANYLREDDGSLTRLEVVNPATFRATGSLYATSHDLLAWGRAMLGDEVLGAESRAVMFDADRPMAWIIGGLPVEGLDEPLAVRTYNGRIIGWTSMLTLIPGEEEVIIVLSNNSVDYGSLSTLTVGIAQALYSAPAE